MPDLILPSLEIQNFRAFEHLRIERLGRVNLITGKNNVGKTSLLEALYLYAYGAAPYTLLNLLAWRDELPRRARSNSLAQLIEEDKSSNIRHLFHKRRAIDATPNTIKIGTSGTNTGEFIIQASERHEPAQEGESSRSLFDNDLAGKSIPVPYLSTRTRNGFVRHYAVSRLLDRTFDINRTPPDAIPCVFITPYSDTRLAYPAMWDKITLTPDKKTLITALRLVAPVEDINYKYDNDAERGRIAYALLDGIEEAVPVRSMGEGINRLLNLFLALTTAKDGILLIDEIETGLHYSVVPDVWRLIFQVAQRLNVQVFATTHSWDCIEAFQQAASEDEHEEGELIRLENHDGNVTATVFDERKLNIATRELIEVR